MLGMGGTMWRVSVKLGFSDLILPEIWVRSSSFSSKN